PGADSGGLLSGIGDEVAAPASVETGERAGSGGGAKQGPDAVSRVALLAESGGVESHGEPATNVIPEGNRTKKSLAGAAHLFRHCQGGRDDCAAGMSVGGGMRIVRLIRVGEHTVSQSSVFG